MILTLLLTMTWSAAIVMAWSLCRAARRGDELWQRSARHEKDPV